MTVFDYCKGLGLEQTRSRAYKKNDQAWVAQKNGAIVRRLVGYGRLSGVEATKALAKLYASSRLYINFFQPSFKLKSKTRDGAHVHKVYYTPATPCDRLQAHGSVLPATKEKLQAQFKGLDPVRLLQEIRNAQKTLSELAAHGVAQRKRPQVGLMYQLSWRASRQPGRTVKCAQRIASSLQPSIGGRHGLIHSPTPGRPLKVG